MVFFYLFLDMAGTEPDVPNVIDNIYRLEESMFELPEEELILYDIDVQSLRKLHGFGVLQTIPWKQRDG